MLSQKTLQIRALFGSTFVHGVFEAPTYFLTILLKVEQEPLVPDGRYHTSGWIDCTALSWTAVAPALNKTTTSHGNGYGKPVPIGLTFLS